MFFYEYTFKFTCVAYCFAILMCWTCTLLSVFFFVVYCTYAAYCVFFLFVFFCKYSIVVAYVDINYVYTLWCLVFHNISYIYIYIHVVVGVHHVYVLTFDYFVLLMIFNNKFNKRKHIIYYTHDEWWTIANLQTKINTFSLSNF